MRGTAPPAEAVVWPRGDELLLCVTGRLDETVHCECGRPLCTPTVTGRLEGALTLDWLYCRGCRAHVVLTIEAE